MIKEFIIKNLISIHSGGVGGKIWGSVQLAAVPAVGISITEKISGWYIDSQSFILILIWTLVADLALGVWKHLNLNTFSFKSMIWGFAQKMFFVIVFYFLSEAFLQIISDAKLDSIYVKVFLRFLLFIWPAGNALVNMGIITKGKFPPLAFLKKIHKFNETLDYNDLKIKKDEKDIDSNIPE
ncbi:hypothetical protein MKJ01_05705 [Chryseobacterium sp. SSA4.19]|uniref:hypothetical protein n=1 Tax=Chryseobacterium sp. SSA4.19 TaxID=2919915 RepID=UPI001F4E0AD2|nr:hypothetical protein [Chryseobacterium sp. SSA4.19]MCJ8153256.1 hypothetical protein [Chryseobacterium sp. SSA4.19]